MQAANRRIIAAISMGGFMISVVTGLVFEVPPFIVILRSVGVALVLGVFSGIVAAIFERIWTK